MKFLTKYNNYIKKYKLINEGTVKSLIPEIQKFLLSWRGEFKDLPEEEQKKLQKTIEDHCKGIEQAVNSITTNLQYKSWIYDILKNQDKDINEDYSVIKSAIKDFEKICKRPDITSAQKNIQNYKHFQDLQEFIISFQSTHKMNVGIYDCFEKIASNNTYTAYLIKYTQYEDCNRLFGGNAFFNTGWCVAKSEKYFHLYQEDDNLVPGLEKTYGYIVWIENSTNRPFALLHYCSGQFKDVSDKPIQDPSDDIVDLLTKISDDLTLYAKDSEGNYCDLTYYATLIWKKKFPNKTKIHFIAEMNNCEYNETTDTIDCKGLQFHFTNDCFNGEGTFTFKLKNVNPHWDGMFSDCDMLVSLPDSFVIPEGVQSCYSMFARCQRLQHLSKNFHIPESVQSVNYMFYGCENLRELPNDFTLPSKITHTDSMFWSCKSLTVIPDSLVLPEGVISADSMFAICQNITRVSPHMFDKCKNIQITTHMFRKCYELTNIPLHIKLVNANPGNIHSDHNHYNMFYDCLSLNNAKDCRIQYDSVQTLKNAFNNINNNTLELLIKYGTVIDKE